MTPAEDGPAEDGMYPSRFQAWRLMAITMLAAILSTIDRSIFSLVIDPIRHDLRISDVQISLLQGLSFGLLYATAGIALGFATGQYPRRLLLAAGIFSWSLATLLGGLATNFAEMFATRIFVGLGEATLAPCAASLIGDLFPPGRRGRPVSMPLMGQAMGIGLSVLLTGFILSRLPDGIPAMPPFLERLAAWRVTFILFGLVGFAVSVLVLTIREPARRGSRLTPVAGSRLLAAADYFRRSAGVFIPFYLSYSAVSVGFYGVNAWGAVSVMRKFGLSAPEVGHALGLANVCAGVASALIAGNLIDVFAGSGGASRKLKLLIWIPFLAVPAACAVLADSGTVAIILLATMLAAFTVSSTTVLTTIQDLTPSDLRGVGVAITGLVNTIVGATCGPLLIALATEHLYGDPKLVGWSIMTVMIPATVLAAALALVASRNYHRRMAADNQPAEIRPAQTGSRLAREGAP